MPGAWKPGDPQPPWSARNQREKDAMHDFVFYELENFYRAQREELLKGKEPIDPEAGDVTILELLESSDPSERAHGLKLLRQLNVRPQIAFSGSVNPIGQKVGPGLPFLQSHLSATRSLQTVGTGVIQNWCTWRRKPCRSSKIFGASITMAGGSEVVGTSTPTPSRLNISALRKPT
jgi:hypothetical protein